ncbi:MAG TPA: heavy metal sensor histidine kinase [Povalibacter sp.]|uniref:heavy metal sensor histidine kinase n=1 Tax=Povalibacter sp. TaxID=1962978 RepID=UPI002BBD5B51|nr:heavy metal sensor histidine kinase [Povalibacter sp.]HMN46142.1 heavy metal sensor histidine kinase [Povalibacter sp.]
MTLSISRRLAVMFAISSFVLLALISVALHELLERDLLRHQRAELNTRLEVNRPLIVKTVRAEDWTHVRNKFEAMTPADGRIEYRILSDDPRFTYGDPLPAGFVAAEGFGVLAEGDREPPRKTLVRTVPGNGERPDVRVMVAADSTPFIETLQVFTLWLVALVGGGTIIAALLGYYIARLGLRPMQRLSLEAQSLMPERLSTRLQPAHLPEELAEFTDSFNGALDRLERAYQQLEAFNADVAHELRTPLTNLIGQTQVTLSRERGVDELKDILYSNLEELERLRAIVNDMLFLARADRGELARHRVEVSVAKEVERTVEFMEFLLEDADMSVQVEGDARACIEPSLLGRAMTNLLQNAIEHAERGAQITVQVESRADHARIAVRNPGSIPQEALPRLFDRFYRGDRARSGGGENHGLGLAIVKAVAAMHGGAVFAASDNGMTTIGFTVQGP